jgi:RNA polymerase sigma-70 factor (ECF subfamily)
METPPSEDLESTVSLLLRIRSGDARAREQLLGRYLPALQRWAHGRLPPGARDVELTDDLVQRTLVRALDKLDGFEPRRPGAFLAYLRQILLNLVRDEIRKATRRPPKQDLSDELRDHARGPMEDLVGKETLQQYQTALQSLEERDQEAIVLRIEMEMDYEELALAIGSPSANAARMRVTRALVKLVEAMGHDEKDSQ